ncbi:MAG: hypothetical protein H6Q78_1127, partial [Candidatus Krumholzibacteriota bacterium]|nr:hypothetical protein [Candidatus Krumholzibacteriota bacterium]
DDFFYVFAHNGELRTNWPQPLRPNALGDYPELVFDERLASPLIFDMASANGGRVAFPKGGGGLYVFDAGGERLTNEMRALPDGLEATPSVSFLTGLGILVSLGRTDPITSSDAVFDSLVTGAAMTLSIQTLGGAYWGNPSWLGYQAGLERQGKCYRTQLPDTTGPLVDAGSFKVYPNPVRRDEVHARVIVNQEASVNIEIYTLEGELAASRSLRVNAAEALGTPVDETIRVADLKSGIYMLRLVVESPSDTRSFTANFAILR